MARAPDPLNDVDALAQLSFVVQQKLQRRSADHDLSMIQTRLLGVLRDRRPTMKELAELLDLDKSSISGLVDRAEQRGLVTRSPDDTDRRAMRVSLSDAGAIVVADVTDRFSDDMSALLDPLSAADRRNLTELISRILPNP
ncbi:MarR family winged helix-turn-helix transcriptional regulator [Gordonia hankookensis]|uniref:MarR family transcriptional regulator n=1 Tax=Gordonia hankookensis TaxID=589403 RepID=A0ABR7WBS9_9ACTN|nr:MarR family transcriptional regulator [Gordonia hankookensis]MBD1319199.1 MarR family transcriptional regulator [Gordonia hankookensis]